VKKLIDLNKYAKPNKTIREHTDDLLCNLKKLKELKYINAKLYELMKIACEYHDYGKISDEFQKRVKSSIKLIFNNAKEVAHNVLSLCFLERKSFENEADYYKIAYAILNHHHNTDNYNEVKCKKELIENFINEYGGKEIKGRVLDDIEAMNTDLDAILLKGFLHKCDYAASGNYEIEYKNDFLVNSLNDNLLQEWKKTDENANWNEMQFFCLENTDKNIIVVANTGMGKTEAGLHWIGDNKGFFILPLKTAINAIYDRIRNKIIIDEHKIDKKLALLHSDTTSYYLKEAVVEDDKIIEYTNKGKQLSLPITISTLDQLFDFVYRYNGYELKLATLSYSKIVIDEIQAYSPDLLAYLIYGLERITNAGGKFAILTATLPPFIFDYINDNIKEIKFEKFTKGIDRHYLKVFEEDLNVKFIADTFKKKGGKILVICNTVKKAQEVYDKLIREYRIYEIELLHAKYTKEDRKIKEERILEFGDTDFIGNKIWITTSVVEASLDIDFDYLFTELNDLNGFFQRLGRVNRKGKKNFMLSEPNVYLFTEIDKNLLTSIIEGKKKGFIDKKIYELSKDALKNYEGILSEEKKVELIEKWLVSNNIKGSNYDARYHEVKKYIEALYTGEKKYSEVKKIFRDIVSYNVIPENVYQENKTIIDKNLLILNKEFEKNADLSNEENNSKREKLILKKLKARDHIYNYSVSVGYYDLNKVNKIGWNNEEIDIVKCNYSKERGFERIKPVKEEAFDNFL
jgi:CRISPR-associated endonuclease/helicase Cas3